MNSNEDRQNAAKDMHANQESKIKEFLNASGAYTIDDILADLGGFYEADRAYIFRIDEVKGLVINTHEWCNKGVEPEIDNLQDIPLEGLEGLFDFLRNGRYMLNDIDKELSGDDVLYQILAPQNIQSIILEPVIIKNKLAGCIGVDNPRANTGMSLVQSVFSNVISTKLEINASNREKEESNIVLSRLCEQFVTLYYVDFTIDYMHTYKTNSDYVVKYGTTRYYSKDMRYYVEHDVASKDRERMRRITDPAYIMKRFETEESFEEGFEDASFGDIRYCKFRFIKANDSGTCAVICGSDVTTQKKEEERKKAELETMQIIVESSEMGTWRIELVEAKAPRMLADEYMLGLLGLEGRTDMTPEEVYNAWFDNIKPEAVQSVLDSVERMKTGKDENTYLWIHPTLGERYVRCGGTSRKIPGGYLMRGYHYDVDDIVREQIKQEEALKDALNAAEHANRAKSTFLNNMSHDIRTPMNAIIGFTSLAQAHIDDLNQVQDYLSKISTSSAHLLSLINDILDMSRIESGTVMLDEKPVHIPELLHNLCTMIQGLISSKNLNLFVDAQDVVHEDVITDKLRLNQVLLNIVSNAIKFTQPGGDVVVRLIEKPCRLKDYARYEFSVKDNGIGMSQNFIKHIFDTFTREQSSTVSGIQGTGLGMAITKNIVDMMGGEITVESEEGKGSLFTVTLDLVYIDESDKNDQISSLNNARVLIIDDDENTCNSVSRMLQDANMRSEWVMSGKEAVIRAQAAMDMKDEYKAYIIDYIMPDVNGIEAVREIRKIVGGHVPVIMLTAYDWMDFEREARQAGVTAFVSKPVFMSELMAVLTQPEVSKNIVKENKKTYDYSGRRILLAEDNELNREIATAILQETGMTVDTVDDGDVAVCVINEAPADKYDLVMMDIQMPKMDGYTATREIRTLPDNKKANIPIVAMTANVFEEDKQKAYKSGMNGHIIKPISLEEIAKVLDEIFADKQ